MRRCPGADLGVHARILTGWILAIVTFAACVPVQGTIGPPIPTETLSPAVAEAIRFRLEFGLRADVGYVRSVAGDPTASSADFGVPLLPDELRDLLRRVKESRDVAAKVREYGSALPEAFGGEFIDSQRGVVVALFLGDLSVHERGLHQILHPHARFEVRHATYTKVALEDLMRRLVDDQAWLEDVGAQLREADLEVSLNRVTLLVGGLPQGGLLQIHEHFGVDPKMLTVIVSESTLDQLPRGTVVGQIVDGEGNSISIRDLEIRATGDIQQYEPDGGLGINTRADGSFEIPRLAEMGWTVEVIRLQPGGPESVLGTIHVDVLGGKTTRVNVPIDID